MIVRAMALFHSHLETRKTVLDNFSEVLNIVIVAANGPIV